MNNEEWKEIIGHLRARCHYHTDRSSFIERWIIITRIFQLTLGTNLFLIVFSIDNIYFKIFSFFAAILTTIDLALNLNEKKNIHLCLSKNYQELFNKCDDKSDKEEMKKEKGKLDLDSSALYNALWAHCLNQEYYQKSEYPLQWHHKILINFFRFQYFFNPITNSNDEECRR